MGILFAAGLVLVLLRGPVLADGAAPAATLAYAHWNVGHFAMGKGCDPAVPASESASRAKEYASLIDGLHADVFGCSEFDPVFDLAGGKTAGKLFGGYDSSSVGPKNSYQCNAIFARGLEKLGSDVVDYTNRSQRTYFIDSKYLVHGREVHFVQTHLDWNSNAVATKARPRQIAQLVDCFASKRHVVIAGDFNVRSAAEYAPFEKAGYRLANCGARGELPTFGGGKNAFRAIDNIVAKGFSIEEVRTAGDDYRLSDHKLLLCTLRMLP